eukprot:6083260-Amphidinium_carterae.2
MYTVLSTLATPPSNHIDASSAAGVVDQHETRDLVADHSIEIGTIASACGCAAQVRLPTSIPSGPLAFASKGGVSANPNSAAVYWRPKAKNLPHSRLSLDQQIEASLEVFINALQHTIWSHDWRTQPCHHWKCVCVCVRVRAC